jgi:hypothetical protein
MTDALSLIGAIEDVPVSQDLREGVASLQRSGPGHATFADR